MADVIASSPAAELESPKARRRMPPEISILLVLIGIILIFEILGWVLGYAGIANEPQSFLWNWPRLKVIILQVSVTGIIAVGVTQVIIAGGIDLSSGSVLGATVMVAASFAQSSTWPTPVYPGIVDLPVFVPVLIGLTFGALAGLINGSLIAYTGIPPFIATLGMMVSMRGVAKWYTTGKPISGLTPEYAFIGSGNWTTWPLSYFNGLFPVFLFLFVAFIFHIALRYTRYGKFTYAIGSNPAAARNSGINVGRHQMIVYSIAGLLAGLAGIVHSARAISGQAGAGVSFELDAIAAAVIGGTSLAGGVGRITGTVIGTVILGVLMSGFTFLRVDAYYQEIIKGIIIVAAVVADQYRQRKRRKA
jgi:inositol transport system permease protein